MSRGSDTAPLNIQTEAAPYMLPPLCAPSSILLPLANLNFVSSYASSERVHSPSRSSLKLPVTAFPLLWRLPGFHFPHYTIPIGLCQFLCDSGKIGSKHRWNELFHRLQSSMLRICTIENLYLVQSIVRTCGVENLYREASVYLKSVSCFKPLSCNLYICLQVLYSFLADLIYRLNR